MTGVRGSLAQGLVLVMALAITARVVIDLLGSVLPTLVVVIAVIGLVVFVLRGPRASK